MGALDAVRGGLGGFEYGAGAISGGAIKRPGGGPKVFGLSAVRSYRGRVNAVIPTAGIQLPAAVNGTPPYTYTATGLPAGLSFGASLRRITGMPTTAHASREVSYTATDSETPANTVTRTFQFPVVGSTAPITRDDWDNRGYGLPARTTYLLALLQGTVNVGSANATVWRRPPDGGAIGLLLDDDGNLIADLANMTFTAAGASIPVSRMTFLVSQDRVELRESVVPDVHFGSYISSTLGSPSLFLRVGNSQNELPYDRGFGSNAQWRRSVPDIGAFLQTIDSGVRYLLAVASA